MRKKKFLPVYVSLPCCLLLVFTLSPLVSAETLYGIIGSGTNAGYLVTINTSNGAATLVGDTGIIQPTGLAYSAKSGILYATTYGISFAGEIYSVNPATGEATRLSSPGASEAIAYRFVDDLLYRFEFWGGGMFIARHGTDGIPAGDLGPAVNAMQGFAVRPSDGVLFGAGFNNFNEYWLFTIDTTGGSTPLEAGVGLTSHHILALAFHPDGTLYGSDGNNLLTINTSNTSTGAATVIGSFGVGPVTGLAVVTPPLPGPIDIWIKDCAADDGTVPSAPQNCPQWWTSPDIWIDNDGNMIIDAPVVGQDNILKALVRNRQSGTAQNVSVKFYYRDNTTGLIFPDAANFIGEDFVTVPPNGVAVASVTWQNLPAPPTTGGHWCIGVVLDHANDPRITPAVTPPNDNNVGIANIWFIAGRAGEQVVLSFNVGTGGSGGFSLREWPREFIVKVIDRLPPGWSWTLEGIEADQPFTLKLGEERAVQLSIQVAGDAAPHTGGSIEVRQVDVATDLVVGGVHFNLYEDHHPPEAVRTVRSAIVDGRAVLTWDPVLKETETGLRERVAYYEILRDGEAVAKVLRDGDPFQPGMQWTDPDSVRGRLTYTVRVVDEGGNVSVVSPEATVTIPAGLFNWLTWLLLIILIILLILLLKRKWAAQP